MWRHFFNLLAGKASQIPDKGISGKKIILSVSGYASLLYSTSQIAALRFEPASSSLNKKTFSLRSGQVSYPYCHHFKKSDKKLFQLEKLAMAHFLKTIFKPKIFFMDQQIIELCRVLRRWFKKIMTGKENDDDNNFDHPFAIL